MRPLPDRPVTAARMAVCPECGERVPVRAGIMAGHYAPLLERTRTLCDASGLPAPKDDR